MWFLIVSNYWSSLIYNQILFQVFEINFGKEFEFFKIEWLVGVWVEVKYYAFAFWRGKNEFRLLAHSCRVWNAFWKNSHGSIDVIATAVDVAIVSNDYVFCGFLNLKEDIVYNCKEKCYAKDWSLEKTIFSKINVKDIVKSFYFYWGKYSVALHYAVGFFKV